MKKWQIIAVIAVLVAGIATNGYFNYKDSQRLKTTEAQIAALQGDTARLTGDVTVLQGDLAQTNINLAQANSAIAKVAADLSSAQSTLDSQIAQVAANLQAHRTAVTSAIAMIEPMVVRVDVSDAGFIRSGSGFIVSNDGYVLTTQRVIDVGSPIQITLPTGEKYFASIVAANKARDLGILKMNSSRTDFPVAPLGSSQGVKAGDEVIGVGFPLGLQLAGQATFTRGIVSAVRTFADQSYIQTDVAINAGSGGGCLVNLEGKVIGVITSGVVTPLGVLDSVVMAIPIDEAKAYLQSTINR